MGVRLQAGREALGGSFEERMRDHIDRHLEEIAESGDGDRRNGIFLVIEQPS